MIHYKVISSAEIDDADHRKEEIKIFFTAGKILLQTTRKGENEKILILIDSAQVITLNMEEKTYDIKKLRERKPQPVATKEIIAGYISTPVESGANGLGGSSGTRSTIWFADSLYFHLPATLEGNDELLMVHNNHIMLKAVVRMNDYMYNEEEEEDMLSEKIEDRFILEAVEIIPGAQPASLFTIPDGFTKSLINVYSSEADTAMVMVDSTVMAPAEKEPPPARKTPAKPPVKTKTTNKSPAKKED